VEPGSQKFHYFGEQFSKAYKYKGVEIATSSLGFGLWKMLQPFINIIQDNIWIIDGQREVIRFLVSTEILREHCKTIILIGHHSHEFNQAIKEPLEWVCWVGWEWNLQVYPEDMRMAFGAEEFFHDGPIEQGRSIIGEIDCFLSDILKSCFYQIIQACCQLTKVVGI